MQKGHEGYDTLWKNVASKIKSFANVGVTFLAQYKPTIKLMIKTTSKFILTRLNKLYTIIVINVLLKKLTSMIKILKFVFSMFLYFGAMKFHITDKN